MKSFIKDRLGNYCCIAALFIGIFPMYLFVKSVIEEKQRSATVKEGIIVSKYDENEAYPIILVRGENGVDRSVKITQLEFAKRKIGDKVVVDELK